MKIAIVTITGKTPYSQSANIDKEVVPKSPRRRRTTTRSARGATGCM